MLEGLRIFFTSTESSVSPFPPHQACLYTHILTCPYVHIHIIRGLSRKFPAIYYEKQTLIEQDTRNIVHRTMTPQSSSKQALWDLTQFSQRHQQLQHDVPSSGSRSCRMNFATTGFSQDPVSQSRTQWVWNPQISFQFSHCPSPVFAYCSPHMFNILRCPACCRPSRTGSLSTGSHPSWKHLCHTLICAALIASALKAF